MNHRLWHQLGSVLLLTCLVWLCSAPAAAQSAPLNTVFRDADGISIVQLNDVLSRPPSLFDLQQRSLLFTPNGAGYTIANQANQFSTALGTKLNLTTAPAINPKGSAEPGDDAYVTQDLGFSFPVYGTNYSAISICSNGNLALRASSALGTPAYEEFFSASTVGGASLVELRSGVPRIAPYWHDLDARASATQGDSGVYWRRDTDRVTVTWNNVRDFPTETRDNGVQRFQVVLFRDGRILFSYDQIQLTSSSLVGLSQGAGISSPVNVNLSNGSTATITSPVAEFFTVSPGIDEMAIAKTFYTTHPGRDVDDFLYIMTDFYYDTSGAQANYLPIRNDTSGIGIAPFDNDPANTLGNRRLQGIISLSNIAALYPDLPTTRFLGAYHTVGLLLQQTGLRWLAGAKYPGGDPRALLGRDERFWSAFYNTESAISHPAARRSSVMEGNAWQDLGNGQFQSTSLPDGFTALDQYLMGLRPANQVPDSFMIANATTSMIGGKYFGVRPFVNASGTKQTVSINNIIAANGARVPDSSTARKNFRSAFILVTRGNVAAIPTALLTKITTMRLAFESYFAQSTDLRGTISTGLDDANATRTVIAVSGASFQKCVAPGEIAALFGTDLAPTTQAAGAQPLPTSLAGVQVFVNGQLAPLYFVSPRQINYQMPRGLNATTTSPGHPSAVALIQILLNGQLIRAGTVQVAPITLGVFTINSSGTGPAVAQDGITYALAPFNARQASGQPNVIAVYGTGLGSDVTDTDNNIASSVTATFSGQPGRVIYAGRAPRLTGVNQINIQFPANLSSGNHELVITRNGIASSPVTIAVR